MTSNRSASPSLLERLPAILGYPAQSPTLWLILALAVLRLLHHLPNVLGLLFEVAFWFMAFKLAVEALQNTSQGRYTPVDTGDVAATDGEAWNQIVLQFLFAVPVAVIGVMYGPIAAAVAASVVAVVMPAAIMLVAFDHSVLHGLNPLSWFEIMRRVGAPYFAAVTLFEALLWLSTGAEALFDDLPNGMGVLPASIVAVYSLVAGFHVIGDLLHRHRDVLGLDVAPAIPRATYASPEEDDAMTAAAAIAREGRPAEAADRLQDLFRGRGASDAVHDRYRQYLQAAGDTARLVRHAREHVPALLATGKDRRAVAIVAETLVHEPGFRLDDDDSIVRLVALALKQGQTRQAVAFAEDFEQRFPASRHQPQLALDLAWPMADRLDQGRQAISRLRAALAAHPQHELAPALRELLERIQQLPIH